MVRDSQLRSTDIWLLPRDEAALGDAISAVLPQALWRCSRSGPVPFDEVHRHSSVEAAVACGGVQAFLDLPIGDQSAVADVVEVGARAGAVVQLLRSDFVGAGEDRYFRSGRLATKWLASNVGAERHALLSAQAGKVWTALRGVTRPARVIDRSGREVAGLRIGSAAREMVLTEEVALGRHGAQRFRLVPGVAR